MGLCTYCGQPAGFLRRRHRECQASYDEGARAIAATVADAALATDEVASRIKALAGRHRVRNEHFNQAIEQAWASCIEAHLKADGVDNVEEERLDAILKAFGTSRRQVDAQGLWAGVRQRRAAEAEQRIRTLLSEAMLDSKETNRTLDEIETDIAAAARNADLDRNDLREVIVHCLETEVERVLEDELLTEAEERAVAAVSRHFGLGEKDLDSRGAWTRMVKAAVLRDLTNGVVPHRGGFDPRSVPFRLQKSETLIWVFSNVDYSTVRTRREFRGKSAGVSIRVAKGVYFRTGSFKGRPVEIEETLHVDTGLLGVTTRHTYFTGTAKSFRVRHDRMVSIEPYSDGFGIMRDTARATPETFRLGDGWFVYNLLRNIEYLDD